MSGRLQETVFYRDDKFAVALWEGNAGDSLSIRVSELRSRSDLLCFTVVLRGGLKMVKPSGAVGWIYHAGATSDEGGDFDEVGVWQWTALESPTQELCFAALHPEDGTEREAAVHHQGLDVDRGMTVHAKAGSLVVIARGEVSVVLNGEKKYLHAPAFAKVENPTELKVVDDGTRVVVVSA